MLYPRLYHSLLGQKCVDLYKICVGNSLLSLCYNRFSTISVLVKKPKALATEWISAAPCATEFFDALMLHCYVTMWYAAAWI